MLARTPFILSKGANATVWLRGKTMYKQAARSLQRKQTTCELRGEKRRARRATIFNRNVIKSMHKIGNTSSSDIWGFCSMHGVKSIRRINSW